jgi:hypothetical protein
MKVQKVLSATLVIVFLNPLVAWASNRDRFPRNMSCRSCVQESLPPRPPQPRTQPSQPTPQGTRQRTQPTPPRTQPTPQGPRQPRSGR